MSEKRPRRPPKPPIETLPDPPWVKHADEIGIAYAAFEVFRDLGPGRTVTDAFRQARGKPEAKLANGNWLCWVKQFRWVERAKAWDDHLAAERQKAILDAQAHRIARWAERSDEISEYFWDDVLSLRKQAVLLIRMPVVEQRKESANGKDITIIEPVTAAMLVAAASMLMKAGALFQLAHAVGTAPLSSGDEQKALPGQPAGDRDRDLVEVPMQPDEMDGPDGMPELDP